MRFSGNLLAVLSILLWCFSGVCFRKGAEHWGAMPYLVLITGGGALFAIVINLFLKRSVLDSFRIPFRVAIAGFFGVAVYTILLAYAFGLVVEEDLGVINLLNYLWPMWMSLFSLFLLKDSVKRKWPFFLGILCGILGLFMSRGDHVFQFPNDGVLPHIMVLVGGMLWALYSVLLKKWKVPEEQGGTTIHFLVCSLVATLIVFLQKDWGSVDRISLEAITWVLFGAVGPVGCAYFFWEMGVKRGSVYLIASLSYFIPIGSTVLLGLLFRDAMNWGLIPGAMLIAMGAWLLQRASRPV